MIWVELISLSFLLFFLPPIVRCPLRSPPKALLDALCSTRPSNSLTQGLHDDIRGWQHTYSKTGPPHKAGLAVLLPQAIYHHLDISSAVEDDTVLEDPLFWFPLREMLGKPRLHPVVLHALNSPGDRGAGMADGRVRPSESDPPPCPSGEGGWLRTHLHARIQDFLRCPESRTLGPEDLASLDKRAGRWAQLVVFAPEDLFRDCLSLLVGSLLRSPPEALLVQTDGRRSEELLAPLPVRPLLVFGQLVEELSYSSKQSYPPDGRESHHSTILYRAAREFLQNANIAPSLCRRLDRAAASLISETRFTCSSILHTRVAQALRHLQTFAPECRETLDVRSRKEIFPRLQDLASATVESSRPDFPTVVLSAGPRDAPSESWVRSEQVRTGLLFSVYLKHPIPEHLETLLEIVVEDTTRVPRRRPSAEIAASNIAAAWDSIRGAVSGTGIRTLRLSQAIRTIEAASVHLDRGSESDECTLTILQTVSPFLAGVARTSPQTGVFLLRAFIPLFRDIVQARRRHELPTTPTFSKFLAFLLQPDLFCLPSIHDSQLLLEEKGEVGPSGEEEKIPNPEATSKGGLVACLEELLEWSSTQSRLVADLTLQLTLSVWRFPLLGLRFYVPLLVELAAFQYPPSSVQSDPLTVTPWMLEGEAAFETRMMYSSLEKMQEGLPSPATAIETLSEAAVRLLLTNFLEKIASVRGALDGHGDRGSEEKHRKDCRKLSIAILQYILQKAIFDPNNPAANRKWRRSSASRNER